MDPHRFALNGPYDLEAFEEHLEEELIRMLGFETAARVPTRTLAVSLCAWLLDACPDEGMFGGVQVALELRAALLGMRQAGE